MARESKQTIREKILHAAKERFWRYGIKKTTIDEIAADAEIGKGTVYLHFDSKEEIAIAIIADYKETVLEEQERCARDGSKPVLSRLKEVLILPIREACHGMRDSPMMIEIVLAVKPQASVRFRGLMEREIGLVRDLLEEANRTDIMHVADPDRVSRLIKTVTLQFMPTALTWSAVTDAPAEISALVDLLYTGLR